MMKTWTRESALSVLLESNGGFKAGTCKESSDWYIDRNLISLREFVIFVTNFLSPLIPSFRLRMFYFKLDLKELQICRVCNKRMLEPAYNENRFRKTCNDITCRKIQKSISSKEMHKNFSEEEKLAKNKKIGISNSIPFDQKFDKEKSKFLRENISRRSSLRVQSVEEKKKRVNTRAKNGSAWHTEETKQKISESNKLTHSSLDFRNKHEETYLKSRQKISSTIKAKILSGEFTPPHGNWKKSPRFKILIDKKEYSFRSKWEAAYFLTMFYAGNKFEYETIRIPYVLNGSNNIFIVDFFDKEKMNLIEVRPKSRQEKTVKEVLKFEAARNWSNENGANFIIIDEDWFEKNWDFVRSSIDKFELETGKKLSLRKPF